MLASAGGLAEVRVFVTALTTEGSVGDTARRAALE